MLKQVYTCRELNRLDAKVDKLNSRNVHGQCGFFIMRTLFDSDVPDCGDYAVPVENFINVIGDYFKVPLRVLRIGNECRSSSDGRPVPFAYFLIDDIERGFYLYSLKKVVIPK